MMLFYSAYKAEFLAGLDSSQRLVATGCKRSTQLEGGDFDAQALAFGVAGMCSFDDFVKFVASGNTYREYYYTNEGGMWSIDQYWYEIQVKFRASSSSDIKATDRFAVGLPKLLPKGGFTEGKNAFAPAILQIGNALQTAREAAPNKDTVTAQINNAGEYNRIVEQLRTGDGVSSSRQAVNNYLGGLPAAERALFIVQYKPSVVIASPAPFTSRNAGTYNQEIDMDKTLNLKPDGTPNGARGPNKNAFLRAMASYGKTATTTDHNNVIQAYHQVGDLINNNAPGCRLPVPTPKAKRDFLYSTDELLPVPAEFKFVENFQSHLVPMEMKFTTVATGSMGYSLHDLAGLASHGF